jgi:flotillin
MARSMPPLMQVMKDIGGIELPDYLARLQTEAASADGAGKK